MELTKTQKTIIRILFAEKSSTRSVLAEKLMLTNAALTLALKSLISEGLVLETRSSVSQKVGRKELQIVLNPEYGSFLSVDIKKHHSYFYEVDFAGNLIEKSNDALISFDDFLSSRHSKVLSIGVVVRGDASLTTFEKHHVDLYESLKKLDIPYYVFNNVDCLADIYFLSFHKAKNFLLVKYGPGVGSSIYANGKPLGALSELGHTYFGDKKVEDTISYAAILNKDMEEKDATALIKDDKEKLDKVLTVLSFALCNADALLSLQKIILSGALLSDEEVIAALKEKILSLNSDFDLEKISNYENYLDINEIKGALGAFDRTFR